MEFVVISGISGAGKSRVAGIMEDLDFYCVDNMPVALLPRFAELCLATVDRYERVALVTDIRGLGSFDELFTALDEMQEMGIAYNILFIDATVETLIRRYKETRRRHPLAPDGRGLEAAIRREKKLLMPVRDRADHIVDTSNLTLGQLQRRLYHMFVSGRDKEQPIHVNIVAFGFKYGIPMDSDLVFDVRYLPNPFYVADLKDQSGLDKPVQDYVFSHQQAVDFMGHLEAMMAFLLPMYVEEGKYTLTVSIGCTGGRHRSVAIAEALAAFLTESGYQVERTNRDLGKTTVQ